jgi:hypothetical protein
VIETVDKEILCSIVVSGKVYELLREFPDDTFEFMGDSRAVKAMALMANIAYGMKTQGASLPIDVLHALKNALFEKFTELDVPSGVILPLTEAFRHVNDAITAHSVANGLFIENPLWSISANPSE